MSRFLAFITRQLSWRHEQFMVIASATHAVTERQIRAAPLVLNNLSKSKSDMRASFGEWAESDRVVLFAPFSEPTRVSRDFHSRPSVRPPVVAV